MKKNDWFKENINSIVLGDSHEIIKNIPDKSIDCIYTDIPYLYDSSNKKYNENDSALDKRKQKNAKELRELNIVTGINYEILKQFIRVMKYVNCFIWCSRLQILDILNFFNSQSLSCDILVWCKTNPVPTTNNIWLNDLEYCLYFREKGKIKLNDGYELKSKFFISPTNKEDKELYFHPTIKPLPLVKRHLKHVMQEGGVILDPYSGSGTTCVAAKELGFNFIGIEINEKFHKISIDRLNGINASGQTSIFTDFENL